jgi:hypothetical protein
MKSFLLVSCLQTKSQPIAVFIVCLAKDSACLVYFITVCGFLQQMSASVSQVILKNATIQHSNNMSAYVTEI